MKNINNEHDKVNQEQNKNKNKTVENKKIKYSKIIYIFIQKTIANSSSKIIISKNSNISQSLMKRSIIINVISPDLIPPTTGLLLNLFYTGMYDQHNSKSSKRQNQINQTEK